MPEEQVGSVTRFSAAGDGRLIGLVVRGSFDEFDAYHPHDGKRSYVTEPELPLQVITIRGEAGDIGTEHVHLAVEDDRAWPTRHKVITCLSGGFRVLLSESDGTRVGEAELGPGDALVCTEGHQIEYLEDGTRLLEVKQGPYLGVEADRHVLEGGS